MVLFQDYKTFFDQVQNMMNQIQNISLTSSLRNETFHPIIVNPHPHPKIHNEDGGIYHQNVQEIQWIPF